MIRLLRIMPLLFLYVHAYSQPTEHRPVQVFTPNAAELGQYGQIPVNYFNGLPEISIPLTTFSAKGYDLPINLTYHASGNHPDAHPGWTGLGWTLHAGGMINRIMNGAKDEKSKYETTFFSSLGCTEEYAYYYRAEEIQNGDWSDEHYLLRIKDNFPACEPGTEPDEFQIVMDDIQASFYIVGHNKVKIKSKTNANFKIDIKLDTSSSTQAVYKNTQNGIDMTAELFTYISEIIITKDDGTKYYFGGDRNAIEFSFIHYPEYDEFGRNLEGWKAVGTANSWLLRRIELLNGETIEFDYEKSGTPIVVSDSHYMQSYIVDNTYLYSHVDTKSGNPRRYGNISFTFIQPSYLCSIKSQVTKNEICFNRSKSMELGYNIDKTIFEYRAGDFYYYDHGFPGEFRFDSLMLRNYYMQLDEIQTKNQRIKFTYSADLQERLKLLSLSFLSVNGDKVSNYDFTYNSVKFPPYNSKQTDK